MAHMMQKESDSIACNALNHIQIHAGTKGSVSPLRALRIVENVSDIPLDMLNRLRLPELFRRVCRCNASTPFNAINEP